MEGYEVVTSDGESIGEVVGERGDSLVVEHGTMFKSRHALPRAFVQVDDDERVVTTTLSKELIHDSPKLKDEDDEDGPDETAVAAYYGLAGGDPAPTTAGYGEVNPEDPAIGATQQGLAAGVEPAEAQRARIREDLHTGGGAYGPPGRPIHPPDPHVTGGPD
jgi:hypothetical protein